ncbi:MAG: hypothetical protein JEZ00_03715 [Anaerolineaceae bacterium]|nr:hypothetical protein [Anaerolineaceae bacterium]
MFNHFPYPYEEEVHNLVLERFLPPYHANGVNQWLKTTCQSGDMLFDAFGSHPLFALQTAAQGYTVFVSSHNPILNAALQTYAAAPSMADFNKALADFSTLKRGDEFLEHLISLYQTQCPECKEITPASAYIWQKNAALPEKKVLSCTKCNASGEYDIDAFDIQILEKIGSAKLHHSRALSSVVDLHHPQYHEIEQMLEIFPLRSLYTIINMANRIKGNIKNEQSQRLLTALLINFCDFGNTLWDPENSHFRPKQINLPSTYKEYNPWLFIMEWISAWRQFDNPIPLTTWPDIPDQSTGGICLVPYRLKESAVLIKDIPIKAVIGLIPRPANAFWSLCAMWSGWLFGKSAVKNMAFAFTRKRYDWKWHANALAVSFEWINHAIADDIPRILDVPELSPGFISALYAAGNAAHWNHQSVVLNANQQHLYSQWTGPSQPISTLQNKKTNPYENVQKTIRQINEPVQYLSLHSSVCVDEINTNPKPEPVQKEDCYQRIQQSVEYSIIKNPALLRINDKSKEKQSGYWWIKAGWDFDHRLTFSEALEKQTHEYFIQHGSLYEQTFFQETAAHFPALFSPSNELLHDCLHAYGSPETNGYWKINEMDLPDNRQSSIQEIKQDLANLGKSFDFEIQTTDQSISWSNKNNTQYVFYILPTGICSPYLSLKESTDKKIISIIFPGSKSKLIHRRLENDPRYKNAVTYTYLIKFRHIIRVLNEHPTLGLNFFLESLDEDKPGAQDMRQMSLFGL